MQNKLKPILTILVVLVGLLLAKTYWPQFQPSKSPYQEKIKTVDRNKIGELLITKGSQKITLTKEGDLWKADGKKGDKAKIDTLLQGLLPEYNPEIVAQTETKHGEFEVTKELATTVKINDLIILIGKEGASQGVYVRFDGDTKVYLLKGLHSSDVSLALSFWADKTVVAFERQALKKLIIRHQGTTYTISKKDDKWINERDGKEPDKDKLEAVFTLLASFTANNLAEEDKIKTYPKVTSLSVDIESDGGLETLDFYQGKDDYLVKRKSDGEQFIVSNSSAEKFSGFLKG